MSPSEVKSSRDQCSLKSEFWNGRGHWMLIGHNGYVAIVAQCDGKESTESITIPRRTFQAMLDWYFKDQHKAVNQGAR